jgi:hypothetical protein
MTVRGTRVLRIPDRRGRFTVRVQIDGTTVVSATTRAG